MAAFIMAFGIASSIIALQTGFKALDVARDSTLASQIMQSEIERIRLLPWSSLPTTGAVSVSSMFSASARIAAKFTVNRTVTDDSTRPSDVKYITIAVTWNSYDGRSHARSFTTMYAKNGLYDYYYTVARS